MEKIPPGKVYDAHDNLWDGLMSSNFFIKLFTVLLLVMGLTHASCLIALGQRMKAVEERLEKLEEKSE